MNKTKQHEPVENISTLLMAEIQLHSVVLYPDVNNGGHRLRNTWNKQTGSDKNI